MNSVYRPITADEFLDMDFGTDKKFELHRGVIYMMVGGTEAGAAERADVASQQLARYVLSPPMNLKWRWG